MAIYRIDERPGIADHDPARPADVAAYIGVVARRFEISAQRRARHALLEPRHRVENGHEEAFETALPLLQHLRQAHDADAGDVIGQRYHPDPAEVKTIDADVARIWLGASLDSREVGEYRGAAMPWMALLELPLSPEQGVAAGGIDEIAAADFARAAVGCSHARVRGVIGNAGFHDLGVFAHDDTGTLRVAQQDFVEFRALDLVCIPGNLLRVAREIEDVEAALIVTGKIGALLAHTDTLHLRKNAETLQDRHVHRQQRLADVEARVAVLLEQQHGSAAARQLRCRRRPGRSSADHDDVAVESALCCGTLGRHFGSGSVPAWL
jgi:hypothetical protein